MIGPRRLTAAAACLAGLGLAGCSPQGGIAVGYPVYSYACCGTSAPPAAWHPGQTMRLQWTAQETGVSQDSSSQRLTLTVVVSGPYADVGSLKAGQPALVRLRASPVITNDHSGAGAASVLLLPSNLPTGYYNVVDTVAFGLGESEVSASVIEVTSGTG